MGLNRTEILRLLRETGKFVSGQELCDRYQVSRQAVWKAINQLKEEGYQVESVPNKGYRLLESPDVLSQVELESRIRTQVMGKSLHYFDVTGSTNVDAKRLADEGAAEGTLVVADRQTQGRGRRGRRWESPSGHSCYFTLLLRPSFPPEKASMLTLLMAHSVALAIEKIAGYETGIKWPNDIVMDGKKVCGILTEMTMEAEYMSHVVIGVGINVNQSSTEAFPEEVREHAASVFMISGQKVQRAQLVGMIMEQFEEDYKAFCDCLDLTCIFDSYEAHLINLGKQVRVLDPKGEYSGTAKGINEQGELLVQTEDGTVRTVYAGEVSVRGLYGYV